MTDHHDGDDLLTDAELEAIEARLTATLAHHADAITVADQPFDPSAPASTPIDLEPAPDGQVHVLTGAAWRRLKADRRARRGRVMWIAVATAAAILVGVIVIARDPAGPDLKVGTSTSVAVPTTAAVPVAPIGGPDAALVPTWTPDGMQLWSITAGGAEGKRSTVGPGTTQLLRATSGDAAILLQLAADTATTGGGSSGTIPVSATAASTSGSGPGTEPIQVRGTTGQARTATSGPAGPTRTLEWSEQGIKVLASLRSLTDEQAVAALDALALRDGSRPLQGFAAPAAPDWTLAGEHLADEPTMTDSLGVRLTYGPSASTGTGPVPLTVTTYGAGDHFPGYLRTELYGSRRPDGSNVSTEMSSAADRQPSYTRVWPDGRTVVVEMSPALDDTVADRIAVSVQPRTVAELRTLQAEMSERLGRGPVIASADLPSGRLELVGTTEPTAICLVVPAGSRSCQSRDLVTYWQPTPVLGTTIIDGSWWVFAAGHELVELTAGPRAAAPAETATIGAWTFTLLPVEPAGDSVSVNLDDHGLNLGRPLL